MAQKLATASLTVAMATTTSAGFAPEAAAVLQRFGPAVAFFGPVAQRALGLSPVANVCNMGVGTSSGNPSGNGSGADTVSAAAAASDGTADWFDIAVFERTERGQALASRLAGSAGTTSHDGFTKAGQLTDIIEKCGGRPAFDAAVLDLFDRVSRIDGGLTSNWFQIGYGETGNLSVVCYTCQKGAGMGIGNAPRSGPFHNFIKHCATGSAHSKARAAIDAQIGLLLEKGIAKSRLPKSPLAAILICHRMQHDAALFAH